MNATISRRALLGAAGISREGGRDVADTSGLLIEYPQGLTVAVLGTLANESCLDTGIRASDFAPQPGANRGPEQITSQRYEYDHLRNFLDSLIMAMLSFVNNKVAVFDAAEEIRLV